MHQPFKLVLHVPKSFHDLALVLLTSSFQYGFGSQTHEHVPLLLLTDRRQSGGYLVLLRELCEFLNSRVGRVDGQGEGGISLGVFVSVKDDSVCRKGREIGERGVHLGSCALEETTAATEEEGVACEDATLCW